MAEDAHELKSVDVDPVALRFAEIRLVIEVTRRRRLRDEVLLEFVRRRAGGIWSLTRESSLPPPCQLSASIRVHSRPFVSIRGSVPLIV